MVADKNPCLCSHAAVVHSLSRGQQKRDRHADSPSPTLGSPLVSPGVPGYGDCRSISIRRMGRIPAQSWGRRKASVSGRL